MAEEKIEGSESPTVSLCVSRPASPEHARDSEVSSAYIPASNDDDNVVTRLEADGAKDEGEEEEREAKRLRRSCLAALEKSPSDRGFSFSFDTKIGAGSMESTPKFGSFKLGAGEIERSSEDSEGDKGEDKRGENEI